MFVQFPEHEVTRINDHVFIHRLPYIEEGCPDGIYRVYFQVGVQYFQVGIDRPDPDGAAFTAKMFLKALDNFVEGKRNGTQVR